MNRSSARSYMVRLVVIVVLAAAGWRFLISPLHSRVQERRLMLETMREEVAAGTSQMEFQQSTPESVIVSLRNQAQALRDFWEVSADASSLYERFDALAHRYGVTIERMEPRKATAQPVRAEDEPDAPLIAEIGYSIELIASYDAIARFMHAVQGETGMVRIDSFRIAPEAVGYGEPRVRASLRTTHFQITGGLAAFHEKSGGAP